MCKWLVPLISLAMGSFSYLSYLSSLLNPRLPQSLCTVRVKEPMYMAEMVVKGIWNLGDILSGS